MSNRHSLLRSLIHLPSVHALAIQVASVVLVVLLFLLMNDVLLKAQIPVPFSVSFLLQGVCAAALSRLCRHPFWWQAIHFCFLPLVFLCLLIDLPAWVYLSAFVFLLALFWSTFRTRVPFYASGRPAWDAVAAVLPTAPLRIIDIGCGIGGLAIDIACRRPDCRVEGIELAPLPWLVSRMRQLLGSPCHFHYGDYSRINFGGYDVVVAYLSPAAMPALWSKARREMRRGTLLLSHEFDIPGVPADTERQTSPGGPVLYGWQIR